MLSRLIRCVLNGNVRGISKTLVIMFSTDHIWIILPTMNKTCLLHRA